MQELLDRGQLARGRGGTEVREFGDLSITSEWCRLIVRGWTLTFVLQAERDSSPDLDSCHLACYRANLQSESALYRFRVPARRSDIADTQTVQCKLMYVFVGLVMTLLEDKQRLCDRE